MARSYSGIAPAFRLLTVNAGATVVVTGMTLTNGNSTDGGAVSNAGFLTLQRCSISGNSASGNGGGGISNSGNLTVEDTTIALNQASVAGGGVLQLDGGTTTLNRCTVVGNSAAYGGGLLNQGVTAAGMMSVLDSTVSGNIATTEVGGIFSGGAAADLILRRSTITGNTGPGGALTIASGYCLLKSSLVAANPGADISGTVDSQGDNLVGNGDGVGGLVPSDLRGTTAAPIDPRLSPLGDYGGETATVLPLPGSPAIEGVLSDPSGLPADQRGQPRPVGPRADIGAVEAVAIGLLGLASNDGDTIPDLLEGSPPYAHLDPGTDDSGVDTDGDGSSDEEEIANMTNLFDPNDSFRILSFAPAEGFDRLTNPVFDLTWRSFPGLSYSLEGDSELNFGGGGLPGPMTADGSAESTTVVLEPGRDFVRVLRNCEFGVTRCKPSRQRTVSGRRKDGRSFPGILLGFAVRIYGVEDGLEEGFRERGERVEMTARCLFRALQLSANLSAPSMFPSSFRRVGAKKGRSRSWGGVGRDASPFAEASAGHMRSREKPASIYGESRGKPPTAVALARITKLRREVQSPCRARPACGMG